MTDYHDTLADYAGDQANARRIAEHRLAAVLDVCRRWEAVADEYDASAERAETGDPRDFSVIPVLIGRIRAASTATELQATTVEADAEHGVWYVRVLNDPVQHTETDVRVNIDWSRDGNLVGIELLGDGLNPLGGAA